MQDELPRYARRNFRPGILFDQCERQVDAGRHAC